VPDLTTYQPPGVYVEDISSPQVTPVGLVDDILCVVAPAVGYLSAVETISLRSSTGAVLRHGGVFQDSSLVLRTLNGVTLVRDVDYAVLVSNPAGSPDPLTTITRMPSASDTLSPAGVADGDKISVTYNYVPSTYYTPALYDDYDLVTSAYGQPLTVGTSGDADSQIASPLSLMAKIAFENGAGRVMCLPVQRTAGTWRDDYNTAYSKILADPRVGIMAVVFPTAEADSGANVTSLLNDLRVHCDAAAVNAAGRMAFAGASSTYDEIAVPFEQVAQGVGGKRAVAVYPPKMNLFNPNSNQVIEVNGGYLAAALAGRLALNDVQRGLTRQVVQSFAGLPSSIAQKMTRSYKDNLSSNGVCVVEQDRVGRLVVRHGVTTDMSSITTREISMVRIGDTLLQNVQFGMDNSGLIGEPITDEMPALVKSILAGILEQEVSGNVIVEYTDLLVRQQSLPNGDPSVIECRFSYRPAVPLNYITVQFSINLASGVVVDDTAAA